MTAPKLDAKESQDSIRKITWGNLTWVDIVPPSPEAMEYLERIYHFNRLALDDCLSRKQIDKVDVFPGYLYFVFHFLLYDKETRVSSKRQWAAFIGEDFIVTVHTGELKTLAALFRDCQANEDSREEFFSHGSGYLLYRILDRSIDSYFPVLDKILNLLEDVEDSVFDESVEAAKELDILRRDIIAQRRVMFPTRALFTEIRNKLSRFSTIDLTEYFDDLMDHMNKICETLDECREIIETFQDTDYTLATHRINRVIRILNIFATIFLPFLVVSSLYGMNIPLPGGLERGSLATFFVLLAVMVLVTTVMLYFFRRRRWI